MAATVVAWTLCPVFAAGSLNWTSTSPYPSPGSRLDSAIVYDSTRHQTILFGGYYAGAKNDTWIWDGNVWTQATPATSPPARAGHTMAYDSVRQQVVLFGGYDATFVDLNDTWVWDGTNWTQKSPVAHPGSREGHGMVFDALHSQVVLFGGDSDDVDLGDTWTWDGTNWTQKSPATSPSARGYFGFAYNSTSNQSVLFGGRIGLESDNNQTWVWNGTTWTQQTPAASPPTRGFPGMVYDSQQNMIVLFGGESFASEGTALGDTWRYNGTTWTQLSTASSPSARIGPAMAFDAFNSQSVMFSGQNADATTWLLGSLMLRPTSLPDATMGAYYSVQLYAEGGVAPYLISVSNLPPGLNVSSGNYIVGQCTGQSVSGVSVSVTDFASPANTVNYTGIPLHCNPAPVITTTTPRYGVFGVPFTLQFQTNALYDPPGAAPYVWSQSNCTLPSSFTLSATGVLSGTVPAQPPATVTQSYACDITFTDRWSATTTKSFTFNFYQPLAITTNSLPSGTAGNAYPATSIAATGGSQSYTFTASGLPTGLSINSLTGAITGTPTQSGSFNPMFTVVDQSTQTAQVTIPLTIAASAPISITTAATLPNAHVGQAYSTTIAWTGGVAPYTVTGTNLPGWLSVNNAGVLSGTPPAGGSFSFTLTVSDSQTPAQNSTSRTFSLTVTAPVITTASPLPSATIGVAYSVTLAASGGVAPYTWAASASLPAWLTLSAGGVLSGTPPQGTTSPVSFTVLVTDSASGTATKTFSLPITTPASLMFYNSSPLANATVGIAYTNTFAVHGGVSPYTYSATGLPAWLSFSSAGTLSGTPPSAVPVTFAVTAADSASNQITSNFTLPVNATLSIDTVSPLPAATVGADYSQTLAASGGTTGYTWGSSGLPGWLTLSSSGVLSGTPPSATAVSFTVSVTDGAATMISKMLTLPVDAALSIGTASPLPAATLNAPYMRTFAATGGSGTYTWSASGLPSGFSVSTSGVLTGTPTSTSAISFNVTVTDTLSNSVSKAFTLPVNAALTITNTSPLPAATVGVAYTYNFTASGGSGTYTWSGSSLPSWLTLSAAGFLSGTPPSSGAVTVQVSVTDSLSNSAAGNFTLPVNAALTIGTSSPLAAATVGSPYSMQLAASGGSGSYSWTSAGLPAWLTLTAGGFLSGTPPSAGPVTFSATVTDSLSNTATRNFTLPVNAAVTIGTTSPLPAATVGVSYSLQFTASGGTGSYTWTASGLPSWLTLSAGGFLSGTPPSASTVVFSVIATDTQSNTATGNFTLPVNLALTIGTSSPLPKAVVGTAYSAQFTASGGTGPYTWTASALPAWLTFTGSGYLSGTPPSATAATFSVTVTDAQSRTATGNFTLPVDPALAFTTTSPLPASTVGTAYSLQFAASGESGSYTWTSSALPSWLTLSASGALTGTPPSAGAVTFPVTVNDLDGQSRTANFTLPVNTPLAIATTSPLPSATVGAAYSLQFAASGGTPPYTWSGGGLPAWLTLSQGGLLTGTPPSAGSFTFSIGVIDALAQSIVFQNFTLQANAVLTIMNASPLPAGTVGAAYTRQLAASGGSAPYTWSASGLPGWLSLSTNGILSGTPPSSGNFTFTATVTDSLAQSVSKSLTLPVNEALIITSASPLATGTVGVPYSAQLAASGGSGPYTWSAAALPSWLTLSAGGQLSGTPPSSGSTTFSVTVTDSLAQSISKSFALPVNATVTITTASPLPTATVGVLYTAQLAASGGSGFYTWAASSLPGWLSLSVGGVLSGTPPSAGPVAFSVTVTDTLSQTGTKNFTLPVNAALTITTASPLPAATVGVAYSAQIAASGGSGIYSWTASNLPAWLAVSSSGVLTGTPPSAGTVTFSVTATDSLSQSVTKSFTLTANATLTITTASPLPTATVGVAYSAQIAASGGSGIYSWTASNLPPWLAVSSSGVLTGTPPSAGTVTFSVTATDSLSQSVTKSFTLTANATLTITTDSPLPAATVGVAYSAQIAASGGSGIYSWTASNLPAWLAVSSSGVLTGTPPSAGTVTFSVTATDSLLQSVTKSFTLTANATLTITTASPLPAATVGVAYSAQIAASGGSGIYSWTASNLPPWLAVSSSGVLTGTPPSAGSVTFSITATDSSSQSVTKSFTLTANATLTITNTSPLPTATVGAVYSAQFAASGGSGTYSWTASNLPAWLTVSSSGQLRGTPPAASTVTFSVTATDTAPVSSSPFPTQSLSVTKTFTLTANATLTMTNASPLPSATVGAMYSAQFAASGGSGTYSWSASNLPSWVSVSSSGVLTGTPPSAGTVTFAITVTDSLSQSVTKSFTLQSNTALTITTASPLPSATVGAAYSAQFAASGGSGSYSWTASNLPAWLAVSSSGVLTGTPPNAGSATFSVTVTDSLSQSVTKSFTLTANATLTITTASPLSPATVGTLYTLQFSASGGTGPYAWRTPTALPNGLTLSSAGILSGTPQTAGPVTFTVVVSDSQENLARAIFTLPVNSTLTIDTSSPLSPGTAGATYTQQFAASGGSGSYAWTGQNLPAWLSLSSTGFLSGTPPGAGPVTFLVTVTDSYNQSASSTFSFTVNSAVMITNTSPLNPGTVGAAYTLQFTASGGTGNYVWSSQDLPTGFALSATGLLSGTSPTAGTFTFRVHAADDRSNSADASFTLTVTSALTISNASPLTPAILGSVYSLQFRAAGGFGPYTWSARNLPTWLTLSSTGFLTGVAPALSPAVFVITVTDARNASANATFTLPVTSAVTIATPSPLAPITASIGFSYQLLASGGSGTYIWSASGLPFTITLSSTGVLAGFGTTGGNLIFTVTAVDAANTANGAMQTYVLPIVSPTPPAITTISPLPAGTVGVAYSQQFSASGGSRSYSWSATGLPANFTFSAAGFLNGTPANAGTYTFTVAVLDTQTSQSVSQQFSLAIYPALLITTTSPLPSGLAGKLYSAQLSAVGGMPPYKWTGSGLPSWLTLDAGGLLSGTPASAGTFSFSATVSDAGGRTNARSFSIVVNAPLAITSASPLPSGTVLVPYMTTLTAAGGVGNYTWSGAGLPSWVSLSGSGVISGTPPMAGSFTVNATVTDGTGASISKQFTILISTGAPLSFVSGAFAPCAVGAVCNAMVNATGGIPPYSFALVGAPSAGSLSISQNGTISGTFPSAGTVTFTVQLKDGAQTTLTGNFSIQVVAPLMVTVPGSMTAASGSDFSLTPAVAQGAAPYTWSIVAGALPPGLALSSTTGVIAGVPTATGTFTFTLQVADATGVTARTVITLVITAPTISIDTAGALVSGVAGTPYTQAIQVSNGSGNLVWSLIGGSLPPGLTFSAAGVLSGTPTRAGDFTFTAQVVDASGASALQTFQLRISGPSQTPPTVTPTLSATVSAGDQPMVTINLSNAYPLPITVTATLQLSPSVGNSTDLLFANGSRTIQFTIPANATQATLPFQAGTLAGTIQISFTLQSAGLDITPSPAPSVTTQIAASAPMIKNVSVSLINGGFQLTVVGISTTRDMKTAAFHFTAANGATLQLTDASVDVSNFFTQWYQNTDSLSTGSQFAMTIPITVGGSVSSIASVTVVMTNSVGASAAVSATIQ